MNNEHYLNRLLGHLGLSVNAFEQEIGVGSGTIAKIIRGDTDRSLSPKTIRKILDSYPNINPTWLHTGKGDMLLKSTSDKVHELAQDLPHPPAANLTEFLLMDKLNTIHSELASLKKELLELKKKAQENKDVED